MEEEKCECGENREKTVHEHRAFRPWIWVNFSENKKNTLPELVSSKSEKKFKKIFQVKSFPFAGKTEIQNSTF